MRFDDVDLDIDGPAGDKYYAEFAAAGHYGDDVTSLLKGIIKAGWCCFDIGANIGLTSLYMTTVAPNVEVVAFEPAPSAIGFLRANVERNQRRLRGGHVEPVQLALMDRKGTAQFADIAGFTAGSHVLETAKIHPYAVDLVPVKVECMTLDDFVEGRSLARLDLVKVDVEGCEEKVLKGAQRTLARFSPLFLFEFNGWFLRELQNDQREQLLTALLGGFERVYLADKGSAKLTSIANTPEARADFMRSNEKSIVDNLLCVPAGRSFSPP